jgi:hypothetical protein
VVGETRGIERRSHDEGSGERLVRFAGLQVSAVMSHTVELAYFPAGFTSAGSSQVCGADAQARGECAIELQLGLGSAISLEDAVRAGQEWKIPGTDGALMGPFIWVEFDAAKQNMLPLPLTAGRKAKTIFKTERWEAAFPRYFGEEPKTAKKKTHQQLDAEWNQLSPRSKQTYTARQYAETAAKDCVPPINEGPTHTRVSHRPQREGSMQDGVAYQILRGPP